MKDRIKYFFPFVFYQFTKHQSSWFFALGILLFIASLFAAVYFFSLPASSTMWDLSSRGTIGDAINGMTAPIIGSVGALLIFISFREQVRANKLQFEGLNRQRELDLVYKFYAELKEDLKEIQSLYGTKYDRNEMLDSFIREVKVDQYESSTFSDLRIFIKYLNDQFIFLGERLIEDGPLGRTEKLALIDKVKHLYSLYFETHYSSIYSETFKSPFSREFQQEVKHVIGMLEIANSYWNKLYEEGLNEFMSKVETEHNIPK